MSTKIKIANINKKVDNFEDVKIGDYFEIEGILYILKESNFTYSLLSLRGNAFWNFSLELNEIKRDLKQANAKRVKSVKIEYEVE